MGKVLESIEAKICTATFSVFSSKTSKAIHFLKYSFARFCSVIFQETAFAVVIQQPVPFARILTALLLSASCHVFFSYSQHNTSSLQESAVLS